MVADRTGCRDRPERDDLLPGDLFPDDLLPGDLFPDVLIREARLVPVGGVPAPPHSVDIRIRRGLVIEVAPGLRREPSEQVHEAQGRWAIPGLWDQHVHLGQWSRTRNRLDLTGTACPEDALARVRAHVAALPAKDERVVIGWGHRSVLWPRPVTVAELDAVSGAHPVVLVGGDAHSGWLNTAALALLGGPPATGPLTETDWFPLFARLEQLPGQAEATHCGYAGAVAAAAARGVVGVVDLELAAGHRDWPVRFAAGVRDLRVQVGVYPEHLDDVVTAGLRSGDALRECGGLVRLGPLKVISDGSLTTRSAWCFEPFADAADPSHDRGAPNLDAPELTALLSRATRHGLSVAVHAIGDAAIAQAIDCVAVAGARGSIEHAQMPRSQDITRMARLGIAASVQPAHLLDDRDVAASCWPDRLDRCYPFRSMATAGVELRLGSDAPVSPLDPWLTIAAAVHRSGDDRPAWNSAEALTVAEALAASTDGQRTIAPGSRGDVVLLDADPLGPTDDRLRPDPAGDAPVRGGTVTRDHVNGEAGDRAGLAAYLLAMPVAATFVAGRATHLT